MSASIEMKFRQSIDPVTPHLWVVYRELENGKTEFIRNADSEKQAQQIIDENKNPANDYYSTIECYIRDIDEDQEIAAEFLVQALKDGLTVLEAVESFFNDCSFDISKLQPLKGTVDEFHTEVRKLNRPYIAISDNDQQKLMDAKADYYLTSGGKVVTFGDASTHGSNTKHALMPLNFEEGHKILAKNK